MKHAAHQCSRICRAILALAKLPSQLGHQFAITRAGVCNHGHRCVIGPHAQSAGKVTLLLCKLVQARARNRGIGVAVFNHTEQPGQLSLDIRQFGLHPPPGTVMLAFASFHFLAVSQKGLGDDFRRKQMPLQ